MKYNDNEKLQDKLKRLSDELAEYVYPLTNTFPVEEKFSLADQIRKSAVSVPANIFEGLTRETDVERKRFMYISFSSLAELKYLIYFASKRKYIKDKSFITFNKKSERLTKLLAAFIKTLKSSIF